LGWHSSEAAISISADPLLLQHIAAEIRSDKLTQKAVQDLAHCFWDERQKTKDEGRPHWHSSFVLRLNRCANLASLLALLCHSVLPAEDHHEDQQQRADLAEATGRHSFGQQT
jgi:hypothetical protein